MTGHWSYHDSDGFGPSRWPTGHLQSPVDIDPKSVEIIETHDAIKFINYDHVLRGDIVNNGHSIQVKPVIQAEHPEIYGGGLDQVYRLVQYHFHWGEHDCEGSEHTVEGQRYPAELHLVHQGTENPDRLAVLGVFLQLRGEGKALELEQQFMSRLKFANASVAIDGVKLSDKLPANTRCFWRYQGSLTTPPCSEVVTWTIFTDPVSVTHEQMEQFRQVEDCYCRPIAKNYRPLQSLNDRKVVQMTVN